METKFEKMFNKFKDNKIACFDPQTSTFKILFEGTSKKNIYQQLLDHVQKNSSKYDDKYLGIYEIIINKEKETSSIDCSLYNFKDGKKVGYKSYSKIVKIDNQITKKLIKEVCQKMFNTDASNFKKVHPITLEELLNL